MRESGIRVVLSEKASDNKAVYSKRSAFLVSLICFVYLLLGEWGILFALNQVFQLGVPFLKLMTITAAVSAGAALLLSFPKWRLYGLLVLLVSCVVFFVYFWDKLVAGFQYIWEGFGIQFDAYFHGAGESSQSLYGMESQVMLAMTGISLVLALFIGSSIFLWRSLSVSLILFAAIDILILVVGLMPPIWVVMVQLVSLFGISMLGGCRNKQPIFGTVTRIDARIGLRQKMQLQVSLGIVLLAAGIMYLISALLLEPTYAKVTEGREITNQIREDIQNFTINGWDDFDFSITGRGSMGLNGGELGNYKSISGKKQTDLYITSDVSYPDTVYIKGFAAGLYAGDHWEQVMFQDWAENYYGSGTWEIVPEANYVSQEYSSLLHLAVQLGDTDQIMVSKAMKVEAEHASDNYSYLPGFPQAAVFGSTMPLYGWAEQISSNASYVTVLTSPSWLLTQLDREISSHIQEEETITITNGKTEVSIAYEQFVRENYLQIPDQVLDKVEVDWNTYLLKNGTAEKKVTYTGLVNIVCSYLAERADYTMSPGKTPSDQDFIDYFLFEQKKGYCVHFASAATMLFRMSGIPARYVEGYAVDGLEAGVKTVVMDTQAHAWCEIYISGFGWVPVDVTPGGREASSNIENEGETGEETQVETVTETEIVTIPAEETMDQQETQEAPISQSPSELPGENGEPIPGTSGRIGTEVLEKFLTVLGMIVLLLLIRFAIRKRSKILLTRRKNRMSQVNCRRAILAAYGYTVSMTAHLSCPPEMDLSLEAFEQAYPDGDGALFTHWKELVEEASFSCHEMTESDRDTVLQFYRYMYQKSLMTGKNGKASSGLQQKCRQWWRTYGNCYPKV